jgi:hypothetical protein
MIERDYIMRMLQMFFDAIAKVLNRNVPGIVPDIPELQKSFNELYHQFFKKSPDHYYGIEKEEILAEIENEWSSEKDAYAKIQMLSELLYQDAIIKNNLHERFALLEKSLYLLEHLDLKSRTFSWDRGGRINDIKKALTEVKASDDNA